MMIKLELIELAKRKALQHGLDPTLVCAVVEQESAWNPYAVRYEDFAMDGMNARRNYEQEYTFHQFTVLSSNANKRFQFTKLAMIGFK